MIPYIVLYIIAFLSLCNKKSKSAGWIVLLFMLFFSVFRGDLVGTDTLNAIQGSTVLSRANVEFDITSSKTYELTTNFVYKLISYGAPTRLIITFYSFITFIFLKKASDRLRINLAILMFVILIDGTFIYSLNIARQCASVAVVMYALSFIYDEKKSILFFPIILFAVTIHTSSIVFIFLYIFRYLVLDWKISFGLIVGAFGISIMQWIDIRSIIEGILEQNEFVTYGVTYAEDIIEVTEKSFMGKLFLILTNLIKLYSIFMLRKIAPQYILLYSFVLILSFFTVDLSSVIRRLFIGFNMISTMFLCYYFTYSKEKLTLIAYVVLMSYEFFTGGIQDLYYFNF